MNVTNRTKPLNQHTIDFIKLCSKHIKPRKRHVGIRRVNELGNTDVEVALCPHIAALLDKPTEPVPTRDECI